MNALTDPANCVEKSNWRLVMLMLELRKGFHFQYYEIKFSTFEKILTGSPLLQILIEFN